MRIASLVPSATEMLYALGLGDQVVAVTHECDYPPAVRSLPHLTKTVLSGDLDAAARHSQLPRAGQGGFAGSCSRSGQLDDLRHDGSSPPAAAMRSR